MRACDEYKGGSKNPFHKDSTSSLGFSVRSAKVIIIGAPGVGKTSLVLRYCRDIFERNYKTTIGVDFEVEKYEILGVPFNMQIWDTAGAERFRGVTTAYFRGAQIVILAFDLTMDESLHRTGEWLREAQEYCYTNFDVFLVATKRDLVSDSTYEEREKQATEFAEKYGAEYWCTSSRTGDNVDALFTRIATVAFESVVMREVELLSQPSNGQLTQNSTLIRVQPAKSHKKKRDCCSR